MVDEQPLTEEELVERLQEEMRRITVPDFLAHTLVSLSSMAFQRLGLSPETVEDRDLGQARMAIDAFEAVVGVISEGLETQEASLYRSSLHQMRMAFVRASGSAAADQEPTAGGPAGDDRDGPAADAVGDDDGAAAEAVAGEEE